MTGRQRLEELRDMRRAIRTSEERIHELEAIATSVGGMSDMERVQTSIRGDKLAEAVTDICEEQDRLAGCIECWVEATREVEEELEELEPLHREVLQAKYVLGETAEETGARMGYNTSYLRRLRMRALEEYERRSKECGDTTAQNDR